MLHWIKKRCLGIGEYSVWLFCWYMLWSLITSPPRPNLGDLFYLEAAQMKATTLAHKELFGTKEESLEASREVDKLIEEIGRRFNG